MCEDRSIARRHTPNHRPADATTRRISNQDTVTAVIAQRIRLARMAAGMTQQELAGAQFSKSYISAIERCRLSPSLQTLGVLADRLGVPVSFLIGEADKDLIVLAARHAASPTRSRHQQKGQDELAFVRLSKAEQWLRQDRPHEAWAELGGTDTPTEDLPLLQLPSWYWLAGWALVIQGKASDALRLLGQGITLAENLKSLAPKAHQTRLAVQVEQLYCALGNAYCATGQAKVALEYHQRGLGAIATEIVSDPELKLMIYKGLGHDHLALGQHEEAMSFYQLAVQQAQDLNNLRQQGLAYWGLAMAYQERGDLLRSKTNYKRALDAFGLEEDLQAVAQVRSLLGLVLVNLREYEEAEKQLRKSLEGVRRLGDALTCSYVWGNLAAMYLAKGDPDDAIVAAKEGLQLAQQHKDQRNEGQLQLTLASAYIARHESVAAEQAFRDAISSLAQTADQYLLRQAHERYAQFLAEQARFQEAFVEMKVASVL